jgi:hypothetical protein
MVESGVQGPVSPLIDVGLPSYSDAAISTILPEVVSEGTDALLPVIYGSVGVDTELLTSYSDVAILAISETANASIYANSLLFTAEASVSARPVTVDASVEAISRPVTVEASVNAISETIEASVSAISETVEASVDATLPYPLILPNSNFSDLVPSLVLTPSTSQEVAVEWSPPVVWPTATTGNISLTPVDVGVTPTTSELMDFAGNLELTRSVGVSPIPQLISLPASPVSPILTVEVGSSPIGEVITADEVQPVIDYLLDIQEPALDLGLDNLEATVSMVEAIVTII